MNTTLAHAALPHWMREYMAWHAGQVASLTAVNWRQKKYLIARCLDTDRACGGVSDRLKSLPVLLMLAARSQRLLLVHWTRPAALEEFLVPTPYINWSLPVHVPVRGMGTRLYTKLATLVKAVDANSTVPVLCARLQDQHGGSEYYNAQLINVGAERAFRTVFRSLFFTFFAPSPAVQRMLREDLGAVLVPGQYAVAHLRAHYGNHPVADDTMRAWAVNAVQCASQLLRSSSAPILFLSDADVAVDAVDAAAALHHGRRHVVTVHRSHEPLHLDKAGSVVALDYASVFVDLLLMAQARCISHGQGGFGRLGVLLSHDPHCFQKYVDTARYIECPWKD